MRGALLLVLAAAAATALASPASVGAATFDDGARDRLVVTTGVYRLVLAKRDGRLLSLSDRRTGTLLVSGSSGCWWQAEAVSWRASIGGCAVARAGRRRFSYRWTARTSTLLLRYEGSRTAARRAAATVTLVAGPATLDVRLSLENRRGAVVNQVAFPTDLLVPVVSTGAGYAPNYLPGIRLGPGFFRRVGSNVLTYPSRWATADFLALDVGRSHLALSGRDPASPRAVSLGFVRDAAPGRCSRTTFCVRHVFQTWLRDGERWTSPVVRIDIGKTARQALEGYRIGTGIAAYPSLERKLGALRETLVRAPLVKADARMGLGRFAEWRAGLRRLPVPSLLHPVSFQPGGHDESFPDFLPPDPELGTADDLRAMLADARALGLRVMPYLNLSWWDDESPTMRALNPAAVSVLDAAGLPVYERFHGHGGYVVTPHAPAVARRFEETLAEWRRDLPVDCLFLDQVGARPWLRDFNPVAPGPLAYAGGWLRLLDANDGSCLMVEDGWDRLARSSSGFHGAALMLAREHGEPDALYGAGNWEPWPLMPLLVGDKVLSYQHDLYEETMTSDLEVLTWNLAFGSLLSYQWDERRGTTLDSPWLEAVGVLQRALGPQYAGRRPDAFRRVGDGLTETRWGRYTVLANRTSAARDVGAHRIAPGGFLARTDDGSLVAGAFEGRYAGAALPPGVHVLLAERGRPLRHLLGR